MQLQHHQNLKFNQQPYNNFNSMVEVIGSEYDQQDDYKINTNNKRQLNNQNSFQDETKKYKIPIENVTTPTNIIDETTPKKTKKNEIICTICELGGQLLMCDGPCLRSFHVECIGVSGQSIASGQRWECDDCLSQQNNCFSCNKRGIVGMDLVKCKVHQCGKFYHTKCVAELKLAKLVNTKSPRFNCPLHYCATCNVSGDGKQSVHCFRCPVAYHVACMPPGVKMLTKSKETRKTGLVLCPKHIHEKQVPSKQIGNQIHNCNENNQQRQINNNHQQHHHHHQHQHQHHHHQQQQQSGNSYSDSEDQVSSPELIQNNSLYSIMNNGNSAQSTPSFMSPVSPISSPPFSPVESSPKRDSYNIPSSPSTLELSQISQKSTFYDINSYNNNNQNNNNYNNSNNNNNSYRKRQQQDNYSFKSINKIGFVPSISTVPSPVLSRSNSFENLLGDELLANSLIAIRDQSHKPIDRSFKEKTVKRPHQSASEDDDGQKLINNFFDFAKSRNIPTVVLVQQPPQSPHYTKLEPFNLLP